MPKFDGPYPKARAAFPTLRQSLLSSFDQCARSTKYEIEYRNGWSSHPQARGQILHRFAAECLRTMAMHGEGELPTDVAEGIMLDVLRQAHVDRECRFCGSTRIKKGVSRDGLRTCLSCKKKFPTEFVNLPLAQVKDLAWIAVKWAHETVFDIRLLIDVEKRLERIIHYPDPEGGSVQRVLTGALDVLFLDAEDSSHVIVYDWKDTWSLPPGEGEEGTDTVSETGYFQQRFYAFLIFGNYPSVQRVTLRERYVRYSKERNVTISRSKEDEIEFELAALAERFDRAYEESLWVATPGKQCNWCARPSDCPVAVFARGDGRITDEARAAKVAASLVVAEKVVKDNRAALRAYADVHGPIPVKDAKGRREFGYVTTRRTEKPTLDQIEKATIEKGAPLTLAELKGLYKEKITTRFQAYTPDPAAEAFEEQKAQEELEFLLAASIEAAAEGRARVGVDEVA